MRLKIIVIKGSESVSELEPREELFECRNGQVIIDPDISEKMFLIKRERPERSDDEVTAYEWSEMGMAELFGLSRVSCLRLPRGWTLL